MNLALNAHEAMPDGGRLLIRSWHCTEKSDDDPRVVIEVTDTGEGMSSEVLSRVFEPFFTTRAPGQGTGLGLSIIHGVVTDHGGRIRVDSVQGDGTSFFINLPAIEPPLHDPEVAEAPSIVGHSRNELVLLVEDHQHVREIVAETLATAGFRVLQSASGSEFLDMFNRRRNEIQLLIADVDIPAPNGVECIRVLREAGVDIPALVITGMPALGLEAELDGIASVLRKPFTMTRLAEVASDLVKGAPV